MFLPGSGLAPEMVIVRFPDGLYCRNSTKTGGSQRRSGRSWSRKIGADRSLRDRDDLADRHSRGLCGSGRGRCSACSWTECKVPGGECSASMLWWGVEKITTFQMKTRWSKTRESIHISCCLKDALVDRKHNWWEMTKEMLLPAFTLLTLPAPREIQQEARAWTVCKPCSFVHEKALFVGFSTKYVALYCSSRWETVFGMTFAKMNRWRFVWEIQQSNLRGWIETENHELEPLAKQP